LATEAAKPVGC